MNQILEIKLGILLALLAGTVILTSSITTFYIQAHPATCPPYLAPTSDQVVPSTPAPSRHLERVPTNDGRKF